MKYNFYDSTPKVYKSMLEDIRRAKRSIFLETYIFGNDEIGEQFREALIRKAKEGVEVKILFDGWGSNIDSKYFKKLVESNGQAREFSKFKFVLRIFSDNHKRDHRKMLVIDNVIAYIGSANIAEYCRKWRETSLRIEGVIAKRFRDLFFQMWNSYNLFVRIPRITFRSGKMNLIGDIPSHVYKPTQRELLRLIDTARKEILIETPYFVPPYKIRRALRRATKRGVEVILITPHISDVQILDIIKERYFGKLFRDDVKIYYYLPKVLHSKMMIVDGKNFLIGSSNLDYRSLIFQYEINLSGENAQVCKDMRNSFFRAVKASRRFNYAEWKNRPIKNKILERFIGLFERIL